jgi:hypothetical protein
VQADDNYITHSVSKLDNATVEWVCLNTVTVDMMVEDFADYTLGFMMGNELIGSKEAILFSDSDLVTVDKFD